jgi:hypothetical protein
VQHSPGWQVFGARCLLCGGQGWLVLKVDRLSLMLGERGGCLCAWCVGLDSASSPPVQYMHVTRIVAESSAEQHRLMLTLDPTPGWVPHQRCRINGWVGLAV